jgi:hypothetical protein
MVIGQELVDVIKRFGFEDRVSAIYLTQNNPLIIFEYSLGG